MAIHKLILFLILFAAPSQSMHLLKRLKEKGITTTQNITYTYKAFPRLTKFIAGGAALCLWPINSFFWNKSKIVALTLDTVIIIGTIATLAHEGMHQKIKKSQENTHWLNLYLTSQNPSRIKDARFFVKNGAELNTENNPLLVALISNQIPAANFLKISGANPHFKTSNNETLLMLLAQQDGDITLCPGMQWLIDQDVDIHARNNAQQTALDIAQNNNHPEQVALLTRYQQ